jgi:tetratricopeptide (TPR) repeat protein
MSSKRLKYNVVVSGKKRYNGEETPLWRSSRVQGYMFAALCVILFLIIAGVFIRAGKTKETVEMSLDTVERAEALKWENMRLSNAEFDAVLMERLNVSLADANKAADTILKSSNDEYTLGTAYLFKGDWVNARLHFSASISKKLSISDSSLQTAKSYYYEGDKRHAKELVDRIDEGYFLKGPVPLEVKADIYASNGFFNSARNLYAESIRLSSVENDTTRMKRNFRGYCYCLAELGELKDDMCILKDQPNGINLIGKYGKTANLTL